MIPLLNQECADLLDVSLLNETPEETPMCKFLKNLGDINDEDGLLNFCRRHTLHGTPFVFKGDEDAYYFFRKRIADKFNISFHEIFITGSAKLGFSPFKRKDFDLDSDIDVAIISSKLYDQIMLPIHDYQMALRESRRAVTVREIEQYHKFLEYGAIGWMRPDKLPTSFQISQLKQDWFSFFDSISYGQSEVGNYKVTAGAFKSYTHLELYTLSGLRSLKNKFKTGVTNGIAN